ncbi:MAG: ABC transporter permease subunit, partial [Paracoccaceae bacterium]
MSAADDTKPEKVFRLSMLIYDTRFRSMTIQVIALMLLMLVGAWLVNNTLNNLAILDKELGFQFLAEPAGYDINQRLIEYTSRSSHARAAFVGILNTLLVAFLGCITATLLGVGAGIARLSKNWVVARLMTVYVEMFRNIPLLLWILVMSAIFIHSLPQPRAFRGGAEAEAHMSMWDAVAFTNRGFYIPRPVYNSGSNAVIIVFLLSIVAILGFGRWARKRQNRTGDILPTGWIKLAIFFAPATLVFFIMGQPIDLEYPALKGFNFVGGFHLRNSLIALWFALSLYTGA